ncbi:MAG: nickel pincer cofactor biosynthesis protein LarB [Dehalococcoidia bacterium]|nr:MAG: nickel pincer cofactor biosynthesis protein LarB [Dehalococcoidia bacterium]
MHIACDGRPTLLREVLGKLTRGEISLDEAEKALKMLAIEEVGDLARLDIGREIRHGIPEVVIAEGKTPEDVAEIASKVLAQKGRVIISRATRQHVEALKSVMAKDEFLHESRTGGTVVVKRKDLAARTTWGRVGIITAGTSDIPIAEEAEVMASEMGCEVTTTYDVGAAGVHRLFLPLKEMITKDVDVIVVVAGREGALPTLLAGMVDVPLIGVPTSFGYGLGGRGVGALMAMLQSCSLGLAVVNIDGGIPAGAVAALIANRAAKFRASSEGKCCK